MQVEAILNSRPLTPLSNEPQDLLPLTPAHFLVARPLLNEPEPDLIDILENRLSKFQHLQWLSQQFWRRWQTEYLSELQRRTKWHTTSKNIKPGMLVLLRDDNAPPLQWKTGRVESIIAGKDGIVRVADVRTPSGTFRRTIANLCPLPVDSEQK